MTSQDLEYLLYSIPEGADYAAVPEDLDLEDVPEDRLDGLLHLLKSNDESLRFDVARLLANWGVEEGFETLTALFTQGKTDGYIDHRLHGYDETNKHILHALIGYWASRADEGKDEEAREKIFPYVKQIIKDAENKYYSISPLFWVITEYEYLEYIPFIKDHLSAILSEPDQQFWNIHDDIKLLLNFDPEFVHQVLQKHHKTLVDFKVDENDKD